MPEHRGRRPPPPSAPQCLWAAGSAAARALCRRITSRPHGPSRPTAAGQRQRRSAPRRAVEGEPPLGGVACIAPVRRIVTRPRTQPTNPGSTCAVGVEICSWEGCHLAVGGTERAKAFRTMPDWCDGAAPSRWRRVKRRIAAKGATTTHTLTCVCVCVCTSERGARARSIGRSIPDTC
eukprot:scaffold4392_cov277-Prasinococcus_capsulatus_cf.AAC.1